MENLKIPIGICAYHTKLTEIKTKLYVQTQIEKHGSRAANEKRKINYACKYELGGVTSLFTSKHIVQVFPSYKDLFVVVTTSDIHPSKIPPNT